MPGPRLKGEVGSLWGKFVDALSRCLLIGGLPEDRHKDQYRGAIQEALTLAQRPETASEIDDAYRAAVLENNEPTPAADAVNVVVKELEAFPRAVQVHEEEQKAGTAKPCAVKRLRAEAKTILRSTSDMFRLKDLSNSKGVVFVLIEALDLVDSA
jgi:hypothetical protein